MEHEFAAPGGPAIPTAFFEAIDPVLEIWSWDALLDPVAFALPDFSVPDLESWDGS